MFKTIMALNEMYKKTATATATARQINKQQSEPETKLKPTNGASHSYRHGQAAKWTDSQSTLSKKHNDNDNVSCGSGSGRGSSNNNNNISHQREMRALIARCCLSFWASRSWDGDDLRSERRENYYKMIKTTKTKSNQCANWTWIWTWDLNAVLRCVVETGDRIGLDRFETRLQ